MMKCRSTFIPLPHAVIHLFYFMEKIASLSLTQIVNQIKNNGVPSISHELFNGVARAIIFLNREGKVLTSTNC